MCKRLSVGADRASESSFASLLPEEGINYETAEEADPYESILPYYESLRARNGDMVGWLRIPGTRISYPVMQTPNSPEYYLDKNFEEEYSASGSLFVSEISDVNLPSDVVTIYGHRMKTGAMFGSLGDFLDLDFLGEHETIIFDTFTERNEYKIYCLFDLDVLVGEGSDFDYYNYNMFDTQERFDTFMSHVRSLMSVENPAYTPMMGDDILLLSTCEYTHEDGRLVLVAVRTTP